jgi:hypothetical protein
MSQEMRDQPEPFSFGRYTVRVDHNTTHRPHNSREFLVRITDRKPNEGLITSVYRCEVDMELTRDMDPRETAGFLMRYKRRTHLFDYQSTDRYP